MPDTPDYRDQIYLNRIFGRFLDDTGCEVKGASLV